MKPIVFCLLVSLGAQGESTPRKKSYPKRSPQTVNKSKPFLTRACLIYVAPAPKAAVACRRQKGDFLTEVRPLNPHYMKVDAGEGCQGYLPSICVGGLGEPTGADDKSPSRFQSQRAKGNFGDAVNRQVIENPVEVDNRRWIPTVALLAQFGLNKAGVPYSEEPSTGLGWSVGLEGSLIFSRTIRLALSGSYQSLSLEREIDFSSSTLKDPSPDTFKTTVNYINVGMLIGFHWTQLNPQTRASPFEGWVDVGGEYLIPLSAVQQGTVGGERSLASPEKAFFLVGGPAGIFRFNPRFGAEGRVQGFYNLAAEGDSSLLGVRFSVLLKHAL